MKAATSRSKKLRDMVASDLTTFGKHRAVLLAILLKVRKRGRGPADFDAEQLWRDLARLADYYFWRERTQPIPYAARSRQLRQLAKALGRAVAALREDDDLKTYLFQAVFDATNGSMALAAYKNIRPAAVLRTLDDFDIMIAGLLDFEIAARRACANVPRRNDGRPKGTSALPPEYIVRLAMLFRSSTGTRPGAGEGPFARFVSAFLDAVGRTIADGAVIDAIKNARAQSLQQPSGWPASPFK